MSVGAGELRERIGFDRRVEVDDGYGNLEGSWQEQFAVAARVRPLKGSEAVLAARLEGRQPVVITIRNSPQARTIGSDWRARNTRSAAVYAIASPPADMEGTGAFLDILATTGEAA